MMWAILGATGTVLSTKLIYESVRFNWGLGFAVGVVMLFLATSCLRRWFDGSRDY